MTLFKWSQTASVNATADSTCPFPEGMAPSAVNDGVRGAMAAVAKYRDDIAGAIVTAGTSTAYTLFSNQGFDSLADMDGKMIAFSPHATNGATVTLNVDSLGAKPLRTAPGVELLAATIIQGTPYLAVYNNTDGAFYLHGFFGNPYNIPLLGGVDYWGATAPNSSFIFPAGQAISRTTYAAAFAIVGTSFGSGDGSTTFNVPDVRGRVRAAVDNLGGGATANRLLNGSLSGERFTVGAAGGEDTVTLTNAQIPSHAHSGTTGGESANHTHQYGSPGGTTNAPLGGGSIVSTPGATGTTTVQSVDHTHSFTTDGGTGGNGAHDNLPPTILCNYIMRII
jgi:microcystin-dependent protein